MTTNPNLIIGVERAFIANAPTAPGANATTVLFATHRCTLGTGGDVVKSTFVRGGGTQVVDIDADAMEELRVIFGLHDRASAANGLRAYYTNDGGGSWHETDMKGYVAGVANQPSIGAAAPIQVPLLNAGQEWSERFQIGAYRGFALTYTAGAIGPTAVTGWDLIVSLKYAPQGN